MLYSEYLTCKKPYQEAGYLFLLERKHAYFINPVKVKHFLQLTRYAILIKQKMVKQEY